MAGDLVTERPGTPAGVGPCPPDPPLVVARLLLWGTAGTVVALVHNRLWATPNLEAFAAIARQWGSDPFSAATSSDYLLTSLSLPTIARIVGMTTPHRYALLHLIVLLVGCAACVALAQRRYGYRTARTLLVLVAVSPGATVVFEWLGQPDALTFPLGIAMVLVRRRAGFVALALLAGFTHPEQAALVVGFAAVVRGLVAPGEVPFDLLPRSRPSCGRIPAAIGGDALVGLLGVAVARLLVEVYLRVGRIGVGRPRSDYLRMGVDLLMEHHGRAPLSLLYLLWGPLWLVIAAVLVLRVLARGPTPDRFAWSWTVLGALSLLALVPVAVTLDETRVYAMLTAPVLAGAAILLSREVVTLGPRLLASGAVVLLSLTLLIPGGFTAGEDAWATEIPRDEFVDFLRTGEAPTSLFLWLFGPFDLVLPDLGGD